MFLEQAGVDMENLVPLDRVMPVNPRHTAQEWQEIYAAQVPSPEVNSNYKRALNHNQVKTCFTHLGVVHKDSNFFHMNSQSQ